MGFMEMQTKNYFEEKSDNMSVSKMDSYITCTGSENVISNALANILTVKYTFIVKVEKIEALGISIKLKRPIDFLYKFEDQYHAMTNDELQIICHAESYEQCLEDVQEELAVLWREIVTKDDSELAPDALRAKKYLLSLAES